MESDQVQLSDLPGPGRRFNWRLFWLLCGLYHLSTANLSDPCSVTRSIVLNSLGGLVFGWLYWAYGLESAMVGHFLANVVIYVIAPVFISL